MSVAKILADLRLDEYSIATGLLHDTVEDTLATQEQIEEAFGKEVAFLVDGLTKISKITLGNQEERQAESFRKMILAMSSDIRILLVRLADRVHNMRTLEFQTPERQVYIAKETLELYVKKFGDALRFYILSHNTVRGAAGASILNAEFARTRGYL
jgi:GTP pyrophosphokinase